MISAKTIKKTALAPTVLVTHAGGFLAGHLIQTLLLKNCRVVLLTGSQEPQDPQFNTLLKSPKFALFECDLNVGIPSSIESVDYIFHLANYDTFINVDTIPGLESLLSAGVGTKNLLDLARRSQAKFALVSPVTSQVKALRQSEVTVREAQKYSHTLVLEYGERYKLDARLVHLGHIYGPGMDLKVGGELSSLLNDVLEVRPLRVYGDGARKEYYLFLTDAVSGLVKSLFSSGMGGVYSLVEEKPHTALELAYLLRSLADGKVDIEFTDRRILYDEPDLDEIAYPPAWSPKVEFKEGLAKTLKSFGYRPNIKPFKAGILIEEKKAEQVADPIPAPVPPPPVYVKPLEETVHINPIKMFYYKCEKAGRLVVDKLGGGPPVVRGIKYSLSALLLITVLSAVLLGVPLLQSLNYARSALNDLENYQSSMSKLDSERSQALSQDAYTKLDKLENSLARTQIIFNLAGKGRMYHSMQAFIASSKNFSSALYNLALGAQPFSELQEGVKPNGTPDYNLEKFKQASSNFVEAKKKFGFAQASLDNVDRTQIPVQFRNDFDRYANALELINQNSEFFTQLTLDVPGVIGLEGPRRYLFLFQNNNEIRPTGGFLGSYAVVEVADGKVVKIDIDDIYNPDGQLKLSEANKDIKPAAPVSTALEEEVLYIRNANWDPDFPQSAQTIKHLFNLVDGKSFDGVFAVDLYFVRDLLSITGPLYLTAYDEEIRVDNMYERAQFHSDFDFKEGVSSKKAFMTVLGGKLMEKLFSLPQDKIPSLLNVVYNSLEQKHLMINLSGSYLTKYLAERGWDGSLISTASDYLYVVNANLGGTKSNYFVTNDMNYAVSSKTSDGVLRAELELTYENTQKDGAWPGGPYKNYVRVLVQDGSKLTGAYHVGGGVESETGVDIMDKVVINRVGKYISFEYPIVVNPQEKVKLLFNYDLPEYISARKDLNEYGLVWQKQPGTQNDSVRFMFVSPFGTKVRQADPEGTVTDNIYEYKGTLNENLFVNLSYK